MIAPLAAVALAASLTVAPAPAPTAPKPCKDKIVNVIKAAGWKGKQVRVAYAVSWRESNHQPGESTYPDLGLFQLNSPSWSGTRFWPSDPLDALSNAKAAHRLWKYASWRPWGLNHDGTDVDMRDYNWDAWQIENWVWKPYTVGLAKFDALPKGCRT